MVTIYILYVWVFKEVIKFQSIRQNQLYYIHQGLFYNKKTSWCFDDRSID